MNLQRFKEAQAHDYKRALAEVKRGRKESCWIWYIFPQVRFEGTSAMSQYYAIDSLKEAQAYMKDPILGKRMLTICQALLDLSTDDIEEVFMEPDNWKLQSSMTLFEAACPEQDIFRRVLEKYFYGKRDGRTLEILKIPQNEKKLFTK